MSKEQYKQKTISVEIGDVLFDPIVLGGMSSIPQNNLKNTLLNSASPIFEELENIYRSGEELTPGQRIDLKIKIASLLAPYVKNLKDFEDITKDTGGYSSGAETHYCFLYQALHNNRSIQEIIDGYKAIDKIGKEIIKTGLKERYHGQFCRDFVTGMSHEVVNQDGETKYDNLNEVIRNNVIKDETGCKTEEDYNQADIRYNEQVLAEFRSSIQMTDAQFKYLEGLHVQTSDVGLATMFSKPSLGDPTITLSSSLKQHKIILNVKEEDGKLVLLGVKHKAVAGHYVENQNGEPQFVKDAEVEVDVDLSHLTNNKKEGEKEFLPLPSQKVTKIFTYTALHEEAEYSLPECLEHRTIDKAITNFVKQRIEEGKDAGDSAEVIQKKILANLVGESAIRQETSPELNKKIELYLKHETPDGITKIVQAVQALVRSFAQAKWISREEYKKQILEEEVGAIKDALKNSYRELRPSNAISARAVSKNIRQH